MQKTIEVSPAVHRHLEEVASRKQMSVDELANAILGDTLKLIDENIDEDDRSVSDSFIQKGIDRYDDLLRRLAQ